MEADEEDLGLTGYSDRCRQGAVDSDQHSTLLILSQVRDNKSFDRLFYAKPIILSLVQTYIELY
jgi:hypothetical protein